MFSNTLEKAFVKTMDYGYPEKNVWAWADILGWNFLRHLGYWRSFEKWVAELHLNMKDMDKNHRASGKTKCI
jgi:hypothetical protein